MSALHRGRGFITGHLCPLALALCATAGCAHAPPQAPAGEPPPPSERIIDPPAQGSKRYSAAGLTHLLRGLYFIASGHPDASIPHLRLSLVYDKSAAFVYERLSQAWGSAGEKEKAILALKAGLRQRPEDPRLNLLAGHLALQDRDFDKAIAHFRLAMRDDRSLPHAGPLLVDALLWLGRLEEATNTARQLLAEVPTDLDMAIAIASFLEDHGQLELSLETYEHARQQRPASRVATIGSVRVLDLQDRTAEAADRLVSLFAFYPDAPELYVEITRLLRRIDNPDAEAYRNEALRQTDGAPRGRFLVAVGDLLEGRLDEGIATLRELIARFTGFTGARLYLAEILGGRRDPPGCLDALAVAEGEPDPYRRTRAWCYSVGGQPKAAVRELLASVKNGEAPGDVLQEGARLLANRFDADVAEEHFAKLQAELGEDVAAEDTNLALALLADAAGRGAEAIELVASVLESRGEDPRLILRLADLEVRNGQPERGVERLEALLAEDPTDVIRLNAFGFTLADLDLRLDEAEVWLRRAHRMASEDGFIIDSLGWLLHRQGKQEEALRLLQRAARASLNDPEILRHIGDVQRALGQEERARAVYQRALEAFPNRSLRELIDNRLSEYEPAPGSS